jgi:hypothetical protein
MSVQNDVKAVTLLLGASPDVVIPFRARVRSINLLRQAQQELYY